MAKLIRISINTYQKLNFLSKKSGTSKQNLLELALEQYKRDLIMEEANISYEIIRRDSAASKEELLEQSLWDTTLSDGLDDD